jgi:hypothetical protein
MRPVSALLWLALLVVPAAAQTPPGTTPPPAGAPPAAPPAPAPDTWVPRGGFELQALDKVTARTLTLTGRVGQTLRYGSLSITVRACLVRGPDQPADAAAFLDIADSHAEMPRFSGWMILSAPGVSMLEHPVYDIHLTACVP